ncbi:MAG TPA: hypothetical protein VHQ01_12965 [Pyrinomonadaceae bacterium]|nr:hypothetical protein [Pyrinomonadaceae bacterium]
MKFSKGLLDELIEESKAPNAKVEQPVAPAPAPFAAPSQPLENQRPVTLGKEHLFETQQKTVESSRNYLKFFGVAVVFIAIAVAAVIYLTLPGIGDHIRVSREMEDAVRNHFLEKEKRTAGDITFYKCDKYTWAHTDVEARTDIPGNPLAKVKSYATRIVDRSDGAYDITTTPITSPDLDTPCR